jgi:hypothetical protein
MPGPLKTATSKLGQFADTAMSWINPISQLAKLIGFVGDQVSKTTDNTGAYNQAMGKSNTQTMRAGDAAHEFNKKFKITEDTVAGAKKEVESYAAALKEKLIDAVDSAKDKLEDAKTVFNDFATSISDGLKQAFSFADAQDAGKETGKGFIQGLRDQVAGVVDYSKKIQLLLDKGLSQEALQQVLDSGAKAGTAIADQLIAGGQTAIDETNALVVSANGAADKVGMNAAAKWYQSGVDAAQKLVDGLVAELDLMTPKLMAKMDRIAAKMKRTVKIDVLVSAKMDEIITKITGGIPKMADGGIVSRPTLALIGEAGPEAVVPLSKMGGNGAGNVNINVNGGLATSAEIGQSIVNALRAYQRSAGPLNLNIA